LTASHDGENCVPNSAFGRDHGAVAVTLYAIGILYTFLGLAILCDDFFTESLEVISEKLSLSPDVAGATFLAAGGSAPELFTSLLTVLTTKNSAGVGTIMGSAVFNLVIIISLSAMFSSGELIIEWRPLARDSVAYTISIVVMIIFGLTPVVSDNAAINGMAGFSWWEAVIMVFLYIGYILVMWQNSALMKLMGQPDPEAELDDTIITEGDVFDQGSGDKAQPNVFHRDLSNHSHRNKFKGAVNVIVATQRFQNALKNKDVEAAEEPSAEEPSSADLELPPTETGTANKRISDVGKMASDPSGPIVSKILKGAETADEAIEMAFVQLHDGNEDQLGEMVNEKFDAKIFKSVLLDLGFEELTSGEEGLFEEFEMMIAALTTPYGEIEKQDFTDWWATKQGGSNIVISVLGAPYDFLFSATIPPCSAESYQSEAMNNCLPPPDRLYFFSFFMSIAWISVLTIFMVLWAEKAGCILKINSFMMGLVVLAAGTSVPDALASISVAKDGHGGMAVSNAIGSNVFDILLGLGIPFIIYSIVWGESGYVTGDEVEVLVAGIQLLLVLAIVLLALGLAKWTLSKALGSWLLILYFVYVVFNILVDRDVIPILEPIRKWLDVDIVDCRDERC
jgi:K+-dependent Na+/Ca+ exchanger-like protein